MTSLDYITEAQDACGVLWDADDRDDVSTAMAQLARANHALCELAPLLVERGVRKGMSQRRMADLLDVPPSALRGAKREFAR